MADENIQKSFVEGKTVLITGASRGIGEAAARLFADAGAKLALVARDSERLAELSGELGPNTLAIPCDVGRAWEMEAAIGATEAAFGQVDILIHNAGVIHPIAPLEELDAEAFGATIDINLKGTLYAFQAAGRAMLAKGGGTLIQLSSGAAHGPHPGWAAYCASKAGALMVARSAHREWGEKGMRVLSLSPGTVDTKMQKEIKASGIGPVSQLEREAHIPPEWVAQALLWMCSPDADEFLGTEIRLRDPDTLSRIGITA